MRRKANGISLKNLFSCLKGWRWGRRSFTDGPFPASDLEAMKRISDKVFANVKPGMKIDLGTKPDA